MNDSSTLSRLAATVGAAGIVISSLGGAIPAATAAQVADDAVTDIISVTLSDEQVAAIQSVQLQISDDGVLGDRIVDESVTMPLVAPQIDIGAQAPAADNASFPPVETKPVSQFTPDWPAIEQPADEQANVDAVEHYAAESEVVVENDTSATDDEIDDAAQIDTVEHVSIDDAVEPGQLLITTDGADKLYDKRPLTGLPTSSVTSWSGKSVTLGDIKNETGVTPGCVVEIVSVDDIPVVDGFVASVATIIV